MPSASKWPRTCSRTLRLGFPMLVDSIDDAVGARYSGMPARLYLIDRRGKVAYKSGRGPFGFKPAELEQSLILLLNPTPTGGLIEATREPGCRDSERVGRPVGSRWPSNFRPTRFQEFG